MLTLEEWMDIKALQRQGHSLRAIAELTGRSRNTVRRLLRQAQPQPFATPQRTSKLDPFKSYIEQRYHECNLSCVRLLTEIQAMGYDGSINLLWRYVRTLQPQKHARQRLTVRFETPPGQQAQADWAYCGRLATADGQPVSIYVFTMVLSFSRMLYVEFTTSMKLESLLRCHLQAFEFFGGWPATILYDNMKQVKLDSAQWNPLFLDFAHHYGFVPHTHAVRRPRTKGKVERMVYYVKDNFLNGRSFTDLPDLNAQGRGWLDHTANVRLHATTGQRPLDLLPKEGLLPLASLAPYRLCPQVARTVDWEGMVHFARSRYSVPPEHAGHKVLVEQHEHKIVIRSGDLIIAEHAAAPRPGSYVGDPAHLQALWQLSLQRSTASLGESLPHWQLTFQDAVATVDLSRYDTLDPLAPSALGVEPRQTLPMLEPAVPAELVPAQVSAALGSAALASESQTEEVLP